MVVASLGDNVEEVVIGIDDIKSLLHHVDRVGPAIIPVIDDNIGAHLDIALHSGQAPPHPYSLPFVFQVSVIGVNKLPVPIGIGWSIFIYSYMHLVSIKPRQELVPDGIHKGVGVGVMQVKKLLRIVLTDKVWTVLCECQGMGWCINFWRNRDGMLYRN